jgi:hypothetical protein
MQRPRDSVSVIGGEMCIGSIRLPSHQSLHLLALSAPPPARTERKTHYKKISTGQANGG